MSDLSGFSVSGEFGAQWLACDFCLRGWPGCDEGGCHQRWSGYNGKRGQGLPQTGAGKPDGRLEVLHLLWFSGLSTVAWRTGGDVLGIHCSVHEHEVCNNHYVDMSLIWKCKRRPSGRILSNVDLYQIDHLAILNVTLHHHCTFMTRCSSPLANVSLLACTNCREPFVFPVMHD